MEIMKICKSLSKATPMHTAQRQPSVEIIKGAPPQKKNTKQQNFMVKCIRKV